MTSLHGFTLVALVLFISVTAGQIQNSGLKSLVDEVWEWRLQESPEFATTVGRHEYNDRLEEYSLQAFQRREAKCRSFIYQTDAFDRFSLSGDDTLTLDMLRDGLQRYVNGYKWRKYGMANPINFLEGIHLDFINLVEITPFKSEVDFEKYIERLKAMKQRINEMITLMKVAISMGTTNHNSSMLRVPDQIARFYTEIDPVSIHLYKPFNDSLDELSIAESQKNILKNRVLSVLRDFVQPAFRNLSNFLIQEYLPHTRPEVGVSSLLDGHAFYESCLQWHLTTSMTAEEVHQRGLSEVTRIKAEIDKIKKKMGFSGTIKDFIAKLKADPIHFYKTEEEILQGYRDIIANRSNPKLSLVFRDYPDLPVEVRRSISDGPSGMYSDPAEDGSRPGIFWVNTREPEKRLKFDMVSLTLHEVSPGHHLQTSYSMSSKVSPFRRKVDYYKGFGVPFHFPFYTAYVEGWALYAESLGEDMGVYRDDYELFGKLISELFRACRLVVDTGLHVKGWGRQKAIDYMAKYTVYPISQTEVEIDRYVTIPGQACSYKIGELKIKELRKRAKDMLGEKFDLKDFHNLILTQSALPLNLLEDSINKWIEEEKSKTGSSSTGKHNVSYVIPLAFIFTMIIMHLI